MTRGEFAAFIAGYGPRHVGWRLWLGGGRKGTGRRSDEFSWSNPGFEQTDRHPVVCVSHKDAEDYATWLSGRTGKRYRLPSEAEWEYAARAYAATTARLWGDDRDGARRFANVADRSLAKRMKVKADRERFFPWVDGYHFTSPVGSFQPNQFGLHDMLGDVLEWVADPWHDNYDGAPADGSVRITDQGDSRRVLRGGSWGYDPRFLRMPAVRSRVDADNRLNDVGFCLARTL